MQKWEYLYVFYAGAGKYVVNGTETPALQKKASFEVFNEFGKDGWEFVQEDHKKGWFFKRPKP